MTIIPLIISIGKIIVGILIYLRILPTLFSGKDDFFILARGKNIDDNLSNVITSYNVNNI